MLRVTNAAYAGNLSLRLEFSDGSAGTADLSGRLDGPVFQPLNDPEVFRAFELTDHTVQWSTGADLAPEYLQKLLRPTPAAAKTEAAP